MNSRTPRYVWPASALTAGDMALLHAVRENSDPRTPISALVARAVRTVYGTGPNPKNEPAPPGAKQKENP